MHWRCASSLRGCALGGHRRCTSARRSSRSAPYLAGLDELLAALDQAGGGTTLRRRWVGGGLGIGYVEEAPTHAVRLRSHHSGNPAWPTGCRIEVEPGRYLVGTPVCCSRGCCTGSTRAGDDWRRGRRDERPAPASLYGLASDPVRRSGRSAVGPARRRRSTVRDRRFYRARAGSPPVRAGDLLAILGAGAYGFAMSSNYNSRARAAEVLVEDGRWAIVRPRERLTDLFRDEHRRPLHRRAAMNHPDGILILDFGSQFTQLIARRVREAARLLRDPSADARCGLDPGMAATRSDPLRRAATRCTGRACRRPSRNCWASAFRCSGSATGCRSWRNSAVERSWPRTDGSTVGPMSASWVASCSRGSIPGRQRRSG